MTVLVDELYNLCYYKEPLQQKEITRFLEFLQPHL